MPTTNGPTHPDGQIALDHVRVPLQAGPRRARSARAGGTRGARQHRASRPRNRPALIVMPDRETPGASARLCARPTSSPCRRLSSPDVLPLGPAVGPVEHEGEDGDQDRDLPRLAKPLLDHALERSADQRGGDRRDDDEPRDLLVLASRPSVAARCGTTQRRYPIRSCQKYATTATSVPR